MNKILREKTLEGDEDDNENISETKKKEQEKSQRIKTFEGAKTMAMELDHVGDQYPEDLPDLLADDINSGELKGQKWSSSSKTRRLFKYNKNIKSFLQMGEELVNLALEYGWWLVEGDLSHLKLLMEQVKFLGLPIEEMDPGHGSVRTPHLEDVGDGGASQDRARLCELFDGLWKSGGQG
ncbi:hypothetical protein PPACK8108_LOCUS9974 [Phakopsora pachyrhizi]|uniref:Uncharacterized protein n=1 Tax=Phakopsora pachyrhizi TaxID=170000 RepID=A0AAV0AZ26_PHAPC|nr:hypothetical protein PPACK8108_LOCUS9974 [Phakopsora pachyrhizi]